MAWKQALREATKSKVQVFVRQRPRLPGVQLRAYSTHSTRTRRGGRRQAQPHMWGTSGYGVGPCADGLPTWGLGDPGAQAFSHLGFEWDRHLVLEVLYPTG